MWKVRVHLTWFYMPAHFLLMPVMSTYQWTGFRNRILSHTSNDMQAAIRAVAAAATETIVYSVVSSWTSLVKSNNCFAESGLSELHYWTLTPLLQKKKKNRNSIYFFESSFVKSEPLNLAAEVNFAVVNTCQLSQPATVASWSYYFKEFWKVVKT